ncbi:MULTISPECIES: Crp/Fnr family transcriptional regulator [Streptomyces]|uniref:Crp/Fnr family transcriptional regulator n=1 Tax=Streptomyces TaxID=1883 RepID=UPI0019CBEF95|nr:MULTISPECIES: Crp/Fnr family transcriptional regulator [Streptomyces]GGS80045.1 hypothetical protein GCM10010286_00550 [Streptomyces toxytricini]
MADSAQREQEAERGFDALIEESSLGTTGARRLRARTTRPQARSAMVPPEDTDAVGEPDEIDAADGTGPRPRDEASPWGGGRPTGYLARLTAEDRTALLSLGTARAYPPGSTLMRQDDPAARHVLLIIDGWVKVSSTTGTGFETLLAMHGPGDIVGEVSVLDDRPPHATVASLGPVPVRVVAVGQDRFRQFLAFRPGASLALLRLVTDRLRDADRRRLAYTSQPVRVRLASLLLELAATQGRSSERGVELSVPLSKQEVAAAIGASREMVQRLLKEFRDRGIVSTGRRTMVIHRPDLLRRMEGGPDHPPSGRQMPPRRVTAENEAPAPSQAGK